MAREGGRGGADSADHQGADGALAGGARQPLLPGSPSPEDPSLFYLYEQYVDEEGYQAHGDSEHFQRLVVGEAIPHLESRERAFYETMIDEAGGLG